MTPVNRQRRGRWSRGEPSAQAPIRSFGGYYRSADRKVSGKVFRGVPLQTAEDTAVAAVRMGYRVIDAQIDRALNMARRLRGAATRAGVTDSNDILNQAERLLSRGGLLALDWLETAANQPENPVMRLLAAEYRLFGSLLGLSIDREKAPEQDRPTASTDTRPPAYGRAAATAPLRSRVRIQHSQAAAEKRRAVDIVKFDLRVSPSRGTSPYDLRFHHTTQAGAAVLKGKLARESNGGWVLEIQTDDEPSGQWRAAVCNEKGEQVGIIEINL